MRKILKYALYIIILLGLLYIARAYLGGYNTYTIAICIVLLCVLDWITEEGNIKQNNHGKD